ncbi:hypothetical protein TorRG33x02_221150, partial [Trema orientale]
MCQRREKSGLNQVLLEDDNIPHWRPLEAGFVKINTDASLIAGNCGTAAIFRDEEGSVLLLSFKSDYANSLLEVQCKTIHLALNIALENGWNKVIIEPGASLVMQSLRSERRLLEW